MPIKEGGDWPPVPPVYAAMGLVLSAICALVFCLLGAKVPFVLAISVNLVLSIYLLGTSMTRGLGGHLDKEREQPPPDRRV
jgi:hypothetical protein